MSPTTELTELFIRKPLFFYGFISRYYPLSEQDLELLFNDLFWMQITLNENVTFTVPLLKVYKDFINLEDLIRNRAVYTNSELLAYIITHGVSIPRNFKDMLHEDFEPGSKRGHPKHWYHTYTIDEIEKNKDLISWEHLSTNPLMNWSKEFIYKFKNELFLGVPQRENSYITNAMELYNNEAVPWDLEIIQLFEDEVLSHKEVVSAFLLNKTMVKNIKPLLTEELFDDVLLELQSIKESS